MLSKEISKIESSLEDTSIKSLLEIVNNDANVLSHLKNIVTSPILVEKKSD